MQAAFNFGQQTVREGAGKQDGINPGELALSTGVGTVAGPIINRAGQGVMEGGKRLFNAAGDLVSPETKADKT